MSRWVRPFGAAVLVLVSGALVVRGNEKPQPGCPPSGQVTVPPSGKDIISLLQKINPDYTALADGYFLYDTRRSDGALNVSAKTYTGSDGQLKTVWNLFQQATSQQPGGPRTIDEYFKLLSENAAGLSTSGKLLLISMLGSALSGCYDHSSPFGATPQTQVFTSLQTGGHKCGVCRDIHTFVAHAATALGFTDAGVHTGNWFYGPKVPAGFHAIAHFRDPATGEYYVDNYSSIIDTHQKTLTGAIDVSTQVLGPLTGRSDIESKPGVVHPYQPRITRWVKGVLDGQADFRSDSAVINYNISDRERTLGINLGPRIGAAAVKGFGVMSDYETADGWYRLEAVGLSGMIGKDWRLNRKYLTEAGVMVQGSGGFLHLEVPPLDGTPTDPGAAPWTTDAGFWMLKANGYARIDKVTGKLELQANQLDIQDIKKGVVTPPQVSLTPSITYRPVDWATLSAERRLELSVDTVANFAPAVSTAYDKVSVVVDTRVGKVYLYNKGELYLFQGLEKTSAIGVRDFFRATLPAGVHGDFSVIADISKVVANPSKDPFYQSDLHAVAAIDWNKPIFHQLLQVGARISYDVTGKPGYFAFENGTQNPLDTGRVTPDRETTPGLTGMAWLHGRF